MSLDPDAERLLEMIRASGRPAIQSLSPQEAREVYRASRKALTPDPPDVAQVDDLVAPGPGGAIPLRMYRGLGSSGKLPVLVFFHGGGFCIGDLDTHDYVCRYIANRAGCAVISVSVAAVSWAGEQAQMLEIDRGRFAVGGDSAGGNLSAVMSHMARDGDLLPIRFQMLLYPSVEMSMRHSSYRLDFSRLPLSLETVRYFHGHYLRDERDQADWRASPLRAATFRGLAPAFILTAGYDPLRDEGAEYARMLEENDVPTTFVHMSDQMHGFLTMGRIVRAADMGLELAATALRRAFVRNS